ncbi:cytochrome P450 monooxygenase [Xylariaceae sp. FL1651]|nr:cytochrome P450 monooxygenase [Xylariaceae sp. FL1651]
MRLQNTTWVPRLGPSALIQLNSPVLSLQLAISLSLVLLSLAWALRKKCFPRHTLLPGIHIVGGSSRREILESREKFRVASRGMVVSGYERSGGEEFYYVPSRAGERLVIPTRFIEELKSAAMDKVDFVGIVRDVMEGDYTGVGDRSRLHPDTLKHGLTPRVASVMHAVQGEVDIAFRRALPPCDDWVEVQLLPVLADIVARVTSRMMGGVELSRNQSWIETAINFTHCALNGSQKVKSLPWLIRPILAPWIREIRKDIPNCRRLTEEAIKPMLARRRRDNEWPNDFLTLLENGAKNQANRDDLLAKSILLTAFASVHTSTDAIMQFVMDLCEHPEYVEILRHEYSSLMDEDGVFNPSAYSRLTKMDSCMKESQRFWPPTLLTFERIVKEKRTLSNGLTVPAGHRIAVSNYAVNMDPNIYPNPETFDGLRFEKIREENPELAGKTQFVSCNRTSLSFGYGRHACPGRAFFVEEFKAIMVYLLEHYDIKFPPGKSRPPTLEFETHYIANPASAVMFKRRITVRP